MTRLTDQEIRSLASRLRTYAEVRIRAAAAIKADIHRTADVLEELLDRIKGEEEEEGADDQQEGQADS